MRVDEEQVRAAAESSLALWPAASAVLLHGSRARGDHLPDSDWDLAVVTDDPQGCPSGLPLLDLADLEPPEVDVAFISDSEIRRCRNLLGWLGCALAREAMPIAGSWHPPAGIGEPQPDPEACRSGIEYALSSFSDAVESVYWSFDSSSTAHAQRSADDFADSSERCAKHLVRAILVRSGRQPRSMRSLDRLADGIAAEDPGLSAAVRSLKGHAQGDRLRIRGSAPWPATADAVLHSARRLKRAGRLLAAELPHRLEEELGHRARKIRHYSGRLGDAQAGELDGTASASGQAALALREGREDVLRGARAILVNAEVKFPSCAEVKFPTFGVRSRQVQRAGTMPDCHRPPGSCLPKPASLPAPVCACACRRREHVKSGFAPDFAVGPDDAPVRTATSTVPATARNRAPASAPLPAGPRQPAPVSS